MKICTRCKETKQLTTEYFSHWKVSKDGFRSWCKKCTKSDNRTRYWRNKKPRIVEKNVISHLQCYTCSELKPLNDEFFRPRKAGKLGFLGICRDCLKIKNRKDYEILKSEKPKQLQEVRKKSDRKRYNSPKRKQYRKKYSRQFYLMRTYNITLEDYEELKSQQNNRCAICGGKGKGKREILDVDHDHKTGKVRGLLCGKCNSGLGMLQNNLGILKAAVMYLEGKA